MIGLVVAVVVAVLALAVARVFRRELDRLRDDVEFLRAEIGRLTPPGHEPIMVEQPVPVPATIVAGAVVAPATMVAGAVTLSPAGPEPSPAAFAPAFPEPSLVAPVGPEDREDAVAHAASADDAVPVLAVAAPVPPPPHGGEADAPPDPDFEVRVGTTWTLRIGLGALAIAAALFARTVVLGLDPASKVALAYAGSLLLFGAGKRFEAKLERFARPVMAGGLALAFFVSYAAHFVPAMRAIPMLASLAWMTAGVVALLILASRWRSQPTAGLAIFLGHVSAFVAAGDASASSLVVITFLSITAVVLLLWNDWLPLSVFAALAAYVSHVLWVLVAPDTIPPAQRIMLNLTFLSSYYLIFLAADMIWWRRRAESAAAGGALPAGGRLLGPVNLVLFVAVASSLFQRAPVAPEATAWFYFAMAALQGGLALWHRRVRNPDYGYYLALGTLLLAIGMFAALDGLALNLLLAALALVLLLAANRMRLRVFHLLAQAVLLSNFVQYWWGLDGWQRDGWPLFLGGVAIAAAYLLMAQLEEGWTRAAPAPVRADGVLGRAGQWVAQRLDVEWGAFGAVLAPLHAVAGGAILMREIGAYYSGGAALLAAAAALVAIAAVAALRRSLPLGLAWLVAQGAILLLAFDAGSTSVVVRMAVVATGLGTSLAVAFMPLERGVALTALVRGIGLAGLWTATAAALVLVPVPPPTASALVQYLLWIVIAGAVFVFAERTEHHRAHASSDPAAEDIWHRLAVATAILGALVVVVVSQRTLGPAVATPVWTSVWVAALVAAAWWRWSPALYLGGAALLGATYLHYLAYLELGRLVVASTGASLAVIGVPLLIALVQDRLVARHGDRVRRRWTSAATYLHLTLALWLLAVVLHTRLPYPWPAPSLSVAAVALMVASIWLALPRVGAVAILLAFAAGALHGVPLLEPNATATIWAGVVAAAALIGVERLLRRHDHAPSPGFAGLAVMLVATAAAVALLAVFGSPELGAAWTTVGWSLMAAALLVLGFVWRSAAYRRVGLAMFGITLVRVFLVDVRSLPSGTQTLAFLVLGLSLVAVAWLYARFSTEMRRWL